MDLQLPLELRQTLLRPTLTFQQLRLEALQELLGQLGLLHQVLFDRRRRCIARLAPFAVRDTSVSVIIPMSDNGDGG